VSSNSGKPIQVDNYQMDALLHGGGKAQATITFNGKQLYKGRFTGAIKRSAAILQGGKGSTARVKVSLVRPYAKDAWVDCAIYKNGHLVSRQGRPGDTTAACYVSL
jgi:hypothetical protein